MLKENQLAEITYIKHKDGETEITDRSILPLMDQQANLKALDVSGLSEDEIKLISGLRSEYKKYVRERMATLFTFESWVEMTHGAEFEIPELKYRTFKLSGIGGPDENVDKEG